TNGINFINDSHYSKKKKNKLKKTIFLGFIYRVFDFTSIRELTKAKSSFSNINNGYYSLQQEVEDKTSNTEDILKYYKIFNQDTLNYKKLVTAAKQMDSIDISEQSLNNSYLKHLIRIINSSKE